MFPWRHPNSDTDKTPIKRVSNTPPPSAGGTAQQAKTPEPNSSVPDTAAAPQFADERLNRIYADYRSLLPAEKIPTSLRDSVLLVVLSLQRVAIISKTGTPEKAQYNNVRSSLSTYRISDELILSDANFESLKNILQSRAGSSFSAASEDERGKRLFEELVQEAFRLGASDIHFRLNESGHSDVRLRLFGRMRYWQDFDSKTLINAVASAYSSKTKFGTNSRSGFEVGVESSTITEHLFDGKRIMGRFAHRPILGGGKTVLRLLETSSDPKMLRIKSFEALGYNPSQIIDQINPALRKNSGLILLSGSTGSGKSTTLRSMMHAIPGLEQLEMYSVEDPTEYVMPWVNQISIQSSADDSDEVRRSKFLSSLRSMMRMDPDVAMIGEVRDTESARIATEMTQTGHRVLSTVHGDGAIDVLSRLTGELLQVPADVLGSKRYLSASIYQKLMPVLCPNCKIPASKVISTMMSNVLEVKFKLDVGQMYCANEDGCESCRLPNIKTQGTKGQTVVAEILIPDESLRSAMKNKDWVEVERLWRGARSSTFSDPDMTGKTTFEHALWKSSIGLLDPRDVELDFEPFETYQIIPGLIDA